MSQKLAPLIALAGADGSGKSTLAPDLLAHIRKTRPAEMGYLGLGSSDQGDAIARWPLIGPLLRRWLDSIADNLRDPGQHIHSTAAARVALRKSHKRQAKFEQMLDLRRRGIVVVTDRYPQIEVAGIHDGPILAGIATSTRQKAMQTEERVLYSEMAAYIPTLVLRLNVDIETALTRKPDHVRSLVSYKIETLPRISFGGAPIVDINAKRPYSEVLAAAKAAVDKALA